MILNHLNLAVADLQDVDALNRRLQEDGFNVPPPQKLHGSWTFYFTAPGGFVIEVLA